MKTNRNQLISIALLAIFLVIFTIYLIRNIDEFRILLDIRPTLVLLAMFCHIVVIGLNGAFIKRILVPFGIDMRNVDSVYVSLISSLGNFLLPMQSGAAIRAVYLKKKYGLAYDNFITILSGNYVLMFFVNSVGGLLAIVALKDIATSGEFMAIGLVFLAMFLATLLTAFTRLVDRHLQLIARIMPWEKMSNSAARIKTGWRMILRNKKLLLDLTLLTVASLAVNLMIIQAELASLGLSTSFWSVLLYAVLGSVVLILNFTPGALGIKEAILIFSASALGLTVPEILSLAIIDRSIRFLVMFSGWALLHAKKVLVTSQ